MEASTAQPVGAQMLAASAPSQSAWVNGIVGNSGNPLQTFQANPNEVLNDSSQYAQLSDLMNKQINQKINPLAANLKQQVQQNVSQNYQDQMNFAKNTGPGSASQQIQNQALQHGLGNVFQAGGSPASSFGQATLQSALGQGVLGANAYQQNIMNQANSNANGMVASNWGNYTPSGSSLENLTLQGQQNFVANQNAATQNLLQNQMGAATSFGGMINNAADQLQATENQNAAARNQASAANLGLVSGIGSSAMSLGGKFGGLAMMGY
jgi:hypothetical protein